MWVRLSEEEAVLQTMVDKKSFVCSSKHKKAKPIRYLLIIPSFGFELGESIPLQQLLSMY